MEPLTRRPVHLPSLSLRPDQASLRLPLSGAGRSSTNRLSGCCVERVLYFVFVVVAGDDGGEDIRATSDEGNAIATRHR